MTFDQKRFTFDGSCEYILTQVWKHRKRRLTEGCSHSFILQLLSEHVVINLGLNLLCVACVMVAREFSTVQCVTLPKQKPPEHLRQTLAAGSFSLLAGLPALPVVGVCAC